MRTVAKPTSLYAALSTIFVPSSLNVFVAIIAFGLQQCDTPEYKQQKILSLYRGYILHGWYKRT